MPAFAGGADAGLPLPAPPWSGTSATRVEAYRTGATTPPKAVARAIAADPAFGPDEYAYKLTGTTFGFRVGINYSPTAHSLLGLGFQRLETRADGGNSYTKSIPEISWDYRF